MAAKNVDIKINTTASGTGAKQTATDMDKLAASSTKAAAATNAASASTSKIGSLAGQAGFQIQDFAIQVSGGTSALTAFSQQAPQLLGTFGPTGAIAGALVAVGAIATKVFLTMAENAAMTGEAMEDMSEKLKEAFSASAAKAIDDFNFQLKNGTAFSMALRDAELQLKEARDQRAESDARLIDSQLKLEESAIKYLQSTGQIVKAEEKLLVVRQQAAEATKNAQIAEANAQIEQARTQYNNIVNQRKNVEADVDEARKRMAKLEAEQQQLLADQTFFSRQDKSLIEAGVQKEGYQSIRTQTATGQLAGIENQIKELYKIIDEAPKRLEGITNEAMAQAGAVDAAIETASIKIDEINQKFDLTTKAQALSTATESITKGAAEIVKGVDQIEAVTPLQQQAKEAILQAASDGVINAKDQVTISGNLRTLMSSLKTGQEGNLETLRELLKLNDTIGIKMQALSNEISGLKQKISNIPTR
jgi:hypothetical protein